MRINHLSVIMFSLLMEHPGDDPSNGVRMVNGVETPDTDKRNKDRTPEIFGECVIMLPKSATVSERFGRRSTAMLNVSVPILAAGLQVDATIWARLERKSDGERVNADIAFPRNVSPMDQPSEDRFKAHVVEAVETWPGFDKAYEAAGKRLSGIDIKTDPNVVRTALTSRLVKDGKVVAEA